MITKYNQYTNGIQKKSHTTYSNLYPKSSHYYHVYYHAIIVIKTVKSTDSSMHDPSWMFAN